MATMNQEVAALAQCCLHHGCCWCPYACSLGASVACVAAVACMALLLLLAWPCLIGPELVIQIEQFERENLEAETAMETQTADLVRQSIYMIAVFCIDTSFCCLHAA